MSDTTTPDLPDTATPGSSDELAAPSRNGGGASDRHVPAAVVTPPHPGEMPRPSPDGSWDLDDARMYLNRELTWLNFNFRVLREALDERTPILERVRFLSIVSSNIDEFFMKRLGGLKQQVGALVQDLTPDGRTPQQQIDDCHALIRELVERKQTAFLETVERVKDEGILVTHFDDLTTAQRESLRRDYVRNVYPLVTPQSSDPAHPFPFVSNLSLNLLVTIRYPGDTRNRLARVKVPVGPGVPRFMCVDGVTTFVPLEDVMSANLDLLFPDMEIVACETFRVTRNSNTEKDEERAEDLLALIETELRDRRFAPMVRLEVGRGMDPNRRDLLAAEVGISDRRDVFEVPGLLGMVDIGELAEIGDPSLQWPVHRPVDHPRLVSERSIFHEIREGGDLLVHHPYQAFGSSVERFLEHASRDPKVRAIKMTFYRTSEDSRAVGYLMDAAREGKQVVVVMELKARFDEQANIQWANRLAAVGIHVTYGVLGLKTHCKTILVVRQDHDGLRRYAHIGTGNYNAETARQYFDIGLMTCDDDIGSDLTELFNYLTTGFKPKRRYLKLLPAPKLAKSGLLERIQREEKHQKAGRGGHIQIKVNALEDPDVTSALYSAGREGVRIELIVRDTCRLRPGLPGISETVSVQSVVGRFLEHARIYYFRNDGDEEYFIGSADLMRRNLENRVEVLVPVEAPLLREELRFVLDTQLADRRSAWDMKRDGSYEQRVPGKKTLEGCHEQFIAWAEARYKEATRLRRRRAREPVDMGPSD